MKRAPRTPFEVYQSLPEYPIELIHGKIHWGDPFNPCSDFEREIEQVVDKYLRTGAKEDIVLASYLSECIKAFKNATE